MTNDYTTTFEVQTSADAVFAAITRPREWWSANIRGRTGLAGDVFFYDKGQIHNATIEVLESTPRVVTWRVLKNHFGFTADSSEWTGTTIVFELAPTSSGTVLTFTHRGLNPAEECFPICEVAWTFYVQHSLRALIESASGSPDADPVPDPAPIDSPGKQPSD